MSNTRPAVGIGELLSGDGPHRDLADRFVEGRCSRCGGVVARDGREGAEGWYCMPCWSQQEAV